MTKAELRQLSELRKLDEEVAEKVMGWKRGLRYGNGNGDWLLPDGSTGCTWDQTPRFSTDIASAWLAVEKMRERGPVDIFLKKPGELIACYMNDLQQYAETAPLAICRAALRAVSAGT